MAENTSYYEDVELADGGTLSVTARKGSNMVHLSYDSSKFNFSMYMTVADGHELRDAITSIMHKIDPSMSNTKKSEPGIGG